MAERCDGVDNDCDGTVDEGFDLDLPCTVGLGACQQDATRTCLLDGSSSECAGEPGLPETETCNLIDDDCDGTVDEVAGLGDPCEEGQGACQSEGVLVCNVAGGALTCNAVVIPPVQELCNFIDDDCDGEVDEGLVGLGEACSVGVGVCSRAGTNVCSLVTAAVVCNVQPGGSSAETCDNLDNDCDGTLDEGFGVGNACEGTGACGLGVIECTPVGGARCSTSAGGSQSEAVAELCDGLDNDCDGVSDETFYSLGNPCYGGCGGRVGVWECSANGLSFTCSTYAGGSQVPPEVCSDSMDNDCDGTVDEVNCVVP